MLVWLCYRPKGPRGATVCPHEGSLVVRCVAARGEGPRGAMRFSRKVRLCHSVRVATVQVGGAPLRGNDSGLGSAGAAAHPS